MSNLNNIRERNVPVTLNGETKNLRYDLNAIAELEDKFGSLDNIQEALNSGSLKSLRTFLWAGLIHENETLTEKELGSWLSLADLFVLQKDIVKAIEMSNPKIDETKEDSSPKKKVNQKQES
jgi:hypothetical protein